MNDVRPDGPPTVAPASIALFAASAVLVGAVGSAQMWEAQLGGVPLSSLTSIAPVLFVGELLAYFAVMLIQLGQSVSFKHVFLGAGIGALMRLTQACAAAVVGSPETAETFGAALAHYYALYYSGAVLQIAVTTLFLWLIRGAFEPKKAVLVPPESDVPDMAPERLTGFHEATPLRRRQELIEELMRAKEDEEPKPPDADTPEPTDPTPVLRPPEPEDSAVAADIPGEDEAPADEPDEAPADHEPPTEAIAVEPPTLTPQQSVLLALREEENSTGEDALLPAHRPEPASVVGKPPAPEPEPPPPPAPTNLPDLASAVREATAPVGAGAAEAGMSGADRAIVVVTPTPLDLQSVLPAGEALFTAAAALCTQMQLGDLHKVLTRYPGGYAGGVVLRHAQRGLFAVVGLPAQANLGVADLTLGKVARLSSTLDLPPWPAHVPSQLPDGGPDDDIQGLIQPLIEWVPEAAGLAPTAVSAAGKQALVLSRDKPVPVSAAIALAHAFSATDGLALALGGSPCDLCLWSADAGSIACGVTEVAGRRLLVALVQPGASAAGPVNIQLGQILNALNRVAGNGATDGN